MLYVAITRAIKTVIISGTYSGYKLRKDSFLGMIEEGLSIDLSPGIYEFNERIKVRRDKEGEKKDIEELVSLSVPIVKAIEHSFFAG